MWGEFEPFRLDSCLRFCVLLSILASYEHHRGSVHRLAVTENRESEWHSVYFGVLWKLFSLCLFVSHLKIGENR